MRQHRHLNPKHRARNRGAKQGLVALVVGVSHQSHTSRQQLRASGLNININPIFNRGARRRSLSSHLGVSDVESQTVVETRVLAALQLSLGHSSLESYIPQTRSLRLVSLTTRQVTQERSLRHLTGTLTNSLVGRRPIHTQTKSAPQILKLLLIFKS